MAFEFWEDIGNSSGTVSGRKLPTKRDVSNLLDKSIVEDEKSQKEYDDIIKQCVTDFDEKCRSSMESDDLNNTVQDFAKVRSSYKKINENVLQDIHLLSIKKLKS